MSLDQNQKKEVINKYQQHDGDTGSSAVQVALLSTRISQLTEHFKTHVKDHSSRRGLIKLVNQRRRLLSYLRKTDTPSYNKLIEQLGLRG